MAFTIRWLGQGGFLLKMGDHALCLDPYLSNSVAASIDRFDRLVPIPVAPSELVCDMLLSTHDHMDHLDPETVPYTDLPCYAGPESCLAHFRQLGIAEDKLKRLGRGDTHLLGDARLTGVYARHTEDSVGLVIEYDGLTVYITGDSEYDEQLTQVAQMGVDVLLVCVNGRLGNMTTEEAAHLAQKIGCRLAIPMHYGMFAANTVDPDIFAGLMAEAAIPCTLLALNQEYDLAALLANAR